MGFIKSFFEYDTSIYLAVIQSSGMGKSRTIDELPKEHFVIPINLRNTGTGILSLTPPDRVQISNLFQGFLLVIMTFRLF